MRGGVAPPRQERSHATRPSRSKPAHTLVEPADFGLTVGAKPVRDIEPRTGRLSMPGDFPTRKGTLRSLRVETTLEMDGLGHLETDPDVVMMATQPHHLVFFERRADGGSVKRIYTPDVAALMADGTLVVIDFKIGRAVRSASWGARAAVIEAAYRDHGAVFRVFDESTVKAQPRFRNVGILLMHRRLVEDAEADAALAAAVLGTGLPTTIGALEAAVRLPHPLPHVNRARTAIYEMHLRGEIALDLGVPLGIGTTVSACANGAAS